MLGLSGLRAAPQRSARRDMSAGSCALASGSGVVTVDSCVVVEECKRKDALEDGVQDLRDSQALISAGFKLYRGRNPITIIVKSTTPLAAQVADQRSSFLSKELISFQKLIVHFCEGVVQRSKIARSSHGCDGNRGGLRARLRLLTPPCP